MASAADGLQPLSHTGRFAPSPTGTLHLGNLRTALVAWLCARSQGSRFLLRVEDLDRGRVREHLVGEQLADLAAVGIDWDDEPVRQSRRGELYEAALDRLRGLDLVYRCFCSRREIREAATARHGPATADYPGTCAAISARESDSRAAAGEEFALRLRAGGAVAAAADDRHGLVSGPVDDLVLVRRDGVFAYNLAVVVDDAEQEIDEVVRGDDLLSSTPDQAFLCDLLRLRRPRWFHVPLVLGPSGARLAKRDGAVTVAELGARDVGTAEVLDWLAASLGLGELGERPTPATLLERFDRTRIPPEPVVFQGFA